MGIRIEKYLSPDKCEIIQHAHLSHADDYEAINYYSFNRLLNSINWNYKTSTLIDFGPGKGAAMILASRFGFEKIIGIEHSSLFVNMSKSYIRMYISKADRALISEFNIFCDDVVNYLIPDYANVFYLFNPFDAIVLEKILQNIDCSLSKRKRDVLLFYFCAIHKDIIFKYGYKIAYKEDIDKIARYDGGNYVFSKYN